MYLLGITPDAGPSNAISANVGDFTITFLSIIFEALPFLVLGALLSGAMEELLPQRFFAKVLPKNRFVALILSSLAGFVLPMCECGIVAVMRRLMKKGVPASCAITYMLSAPVINPIVLFSTAFAFWSTKYELFGIPGFKMVLLRAGFAFVTAILVGWTIELFTRRGLGVVASGADRVRLVETDESRRLSEEDPNEATPGDHGQASCQHQHGPGETCDHDHDHHHHDHDHEHPHGSEQGAGAGHHHHEHEPAKRSILDRLSGIANIALADFLDIAAFLVIGAALAALVNTFLSREWLDSMGRFNYGSIFGMMLLAYFLSLCSEADAFVAANFTSFTTASKLSFLVLGPMLDVKLTIMYRWVFTKKAMAIVVGTILSTIVIACCLLEFLTPFIFAASGS